MLAFLLVAAVVFAILAWMVEEATVKKVSTVLFVVCAIAFLVLILLHAAGTNFNFGLP